MVGNRCFYLLTRDVSRSVNYAFREHDFPEQSVVCRGRDSRRLSAGARIGLSAFEAADGEYFNLYYRAVYYFRVRLCIFVAR